MTWMTFASTYPCPGRPAAARPGPISPWRSAPSTPPPASSGARTRGWSSSPSATAGWRRCGPPFPEPPWACSPPATTARSSPVTTNSRRVCPMCRTLSGGRRVLVPVTLVLVFGTAGCGTRLYPVRGTVTLEDGTPLTQGMVIFESNQKGAAVMARGEVKPDGSYQLSTYKPGDGVPPGKYRVRINPMDLSEVPDEKKNLPFDIKYTTLATSGLEYEVKPGPNEFLIKLDRPRKRG